MERSDRRSVALAFPNMNNGPVLDLFFERLVANTTYPDVEVVVVDDGSTDDSVPILRRWRDSGAFPSFTLIEQENRGVPQAFNRALEAVSNEIVVRLDGDATIETPGWLERMLSFYLSDERIGVVVSGIVFENGEIHSLGRNLVCPEGLHDRGSIPREPPGLRRLDSNVRRFNRERAPVPLEIAEVDTALGCCTMFLKALADELGGLDARYAPVWIEDDDFGFAARVRGKKVFCLPEIEVVHRIGMRNPRAGGSSMQSASPLQSAVGRLMPRRVKDRLKPGLGVGRDAPWRVELLRRHYAAWHEKWGFDPLNPNLDEIADLYPDSEVLWRLDADRRRAGEEIASSFAAGQRGSSSGDARARGGPAVSGRA
jgi:GT2 family glycosyltransferase